MKNLWDLVEDWGGGGSLPDLQYGTLLMFENDPLYSNKEVLRIFLRLVNNFSWCQLLEFVPMKIEH